MRFRESLSELLATPSRVKVLRFLLRNPDIPFAGREIARNLGLSPSSVTAHLFQLERFGIVMSIVKGRAVLHRVNMRHIIVPQLWALFELERDFLPSALKQLAVAWRRDARSVIVFGSVARGEELSGSDVDLCVVTRTAKAGRAMEAKLHNCQTDFSAVTGNRLSPLILSATSFRTRYRQGDTLVRQIGREGKVIFGESIGELVA